MHKRNIDDRLLRAKLDEVTDSALTATNEEIEAMLQAGGVSPTEAVERVTRIAAKVRAGLRRLSMSLDAGTPATSKVKR